MKTKGIVTSEHIQKLNSDYGGCLHIPHQIGRELSMKSMMISCFAYGSIDKSKYWFERYILPCQKDLSKKVFDEVYNEMSCYLLKCQINHSVYTDSEGGSYNSVTLIN